MFTSYQLKSRWILKNDIGAGHWNSAPDAIVHKMISRNVSARTGFEHNEHVNGMLPRF